MSKEKTKKTAKAKAPAKVKAKAAKAKAAKAKPPKVEIAPKVKKEKVIKTKSNKQGSGLSRLRDSSIIEKKWFKISHIVFSFILLLVAVLGFLVYMRTVQGINAFNKEIADKVLPPEKSGEPATLNGIKIMTLLISVIGILVAIPGFIMYAPLKIHKNGIYVFSIMAAQFILLIAIVIIALMCYFDTNSTVIDWLTNFKPLF